MITHDIVTRLGRFHRDHKHRDHRLGHHHHESKDKRGFCSLSIVFGKVITITII